MTRQCCSTVYCTSAQGLWHICAASEKKELADAQSQFCVHLTAMSPHQKVFHYVHPKERGGDKLSTMGGILIFIEAGPPPGSICYMELAFTYAEVGKIIMV